MHISDWSGCIQLRHLYNPNHLHLSSHWIVGVRDEDNAPGTKMPRLYPGMAVWRHSLTTQKCRTSALNRKPRLFKFAFFANMASDHSSASLYFVRL